MSSQHRDQNRYLEFRNNRPVIFIAQYEPPFHISPTDPASELISDLVSSFDYKWHWFKMRDIFTHAQVRVVPTTSHERQASYRDAFGQKIGREVVTTKSMKVVMYRIAKEQNRRLFMQHLSHDVVWAQLIAPKAETAIMDAQKRLDRALKVLEQAENEYRLYTSQAVSQQDRFEYMQRMEAEWEKGRPYD